MADKEKERVGQILDAYFFESLPKELDRDILSWLFDEGHEEEKDYKLEELWESVVVYEQEPVNEQYILKRLADIKQRLGLPPVGMKRQGKKEAVKRKRSVKRPVWIAAAVLIPFLALTGVLLFTAKDKENVTVAEVCSISAGERHHIVLPDGSEVWLESGTLEYPEDFAQEPAGKRSLKLEGEAYFKVTGDESKPFVVHTSKLYVRVLGTEFWVSAVPMAEETVVELKKGSIEVVFEDGGNVNYLLNKQARLKYKHQQQTVETGPIEIETEAGGLVEHNGRRVFEQASLDSVFRALEERYAIVIECDPGLANEAVTIKLTGDETLETVLSRLSEVTGTFSYKIETNKVFIYPNQ